MIATLVRAVEFAVSCKAWAFIRLYFASPMPTRWLDGCSTVRKVVNLPGRIRAGLCGDRLPGT